MEQLLETILAALASGASDEAKAAGASACRTIVTALEAKAGEPMAMVTPSAPSLPIEAIAAAVRGMPVDQLLDVAIARLRAALPAETAATKVTPFTIPLVPIPKRG
jgi:hypothetical protein